MIQLPQKLKNPPALVGVDADNMSNEKIERNLTICKEYYEEGLSINLLAIKYDITKQMVYKIIKREKYDPNQSGMSYQSPSPSSQ